ncbi:polysaccharide lyase family 7 protein [Pseudomonas chlororaphis]|uniref:polysaccharide lyase family 7 protein n=1 Tax=Pseudomonas chlororaphis TaxID=587753 RepID=UPI0006A640CF|nr:polysaccharide lyase family 7 protein [Pseudomonas chlororaphis]AZD04974.1 lyase, putative [Pseudomonas chlororaphis subsp. chlororaphis]MBM0285537.1 polysaccharide lyase family 7 protein [Pseudomonas chlororaphis]MDO1507700.1 polysaccharide lyase family 7 protein [Pseudomonas chlororaphis]ORM47709.1 polysaccharide lyase family 7 protein [Pseudomonas chlororaphis subsp. chlororaphis]TWR90647.1 polysaccharide lyase family 7 protein [Pseudomonas chlororaphis subsp. chlororaphis]
MIDLATWNLSIPEGSPPATIDTPRLVEGFKDQYFHSDTGTLFFWSPVTGSRTANAIYPRSELRETYSNGTLKNWTYPEADNLLYATLAVNQVPSTGKIVIGQIHAYNSTKPLVKVEYQYKTTTQSGNIVAKVRMHPDDTDSRVIIVAENVPLDREFSYLIHLSPGGALGVSAAGYQWDTQLSSTWRDKPLYFKAGVYVQDNTGYTTEGGKVTFYRLDIDHNET